MAFHGFKTQAITLEVQMGTSLLEVQFELTQRYEDGISLI